MHRKLNAFSLAILAAAAFAQQPPTTPDALPTSQPSFSYEAPPPGDLLVYDSEKTPDGEIQLFSAEPPALSYVGGNGELRLPPDFGFLYSRSSKEVARSSAPATVSAAPATEPVTQNQFLPQVKPPSVIPPAAPQAQAKEPAAQQRPAVTNTVPASELENVLKPATMIEATMYSAAVVPEGYTVPVLTRAKPDWCGEEAGCDDLRFMGDAKVIAGGRVEIQYKYAVLNGVPMEVKASVFSHDDFGYGLKGDVVETAPSIAADLVRGTLGGISDWTNASLQAQQSYVTADGTVAVTKTTPPLSSFLASRAANLFSLPQNTKALLRSVVVPANTPVYVYVQMPVEKQR